jgi:carbamate kinase
MLIVVALGGNALLRRDQRPDIATQQRNLADAAVAIAELAHEHAIVVTHGNGPQIGLVALQDEGSADLPGAPLDVLGAESEGMIGYLIEQELANRLPGRDIATLLTRVLVHPADPAFTRPTKPIGPGYPEAEARLLATSRGWTVARDGRKFRRVVPSPEPRCILERRTIRLLVDAGVIVVCAGGGGIPVIEDARRAVHGVEAVIDKDLAAALLAQELGAEALMLLTDVRAVFADWPRPARRPIREATAASLRKRQFAPGSMAPKVEAACRFAEGAGGLAMIGRLGDATRLLRGETGTTVLPSVSSRAA